MSNRTANTVEESDMMLLRLLSDYCKNQVVSQCICQNIGRLPISAPFNMEEGNATEGPITLKTFRKIARNSAKYNKYVLHIFTSTSVELRLQYCCDCMEKDFVWKNDGLSIFMSLLQY